MHTYTLTYSCTLEVVEQNLNMGNLALHTNVLTPSGHWLLPKRLNLAG